MGKTRILEGIILSYLITSKYFELDTNSKKTTLFILVAPHKPIVSILPTHT